MSNLNPNSSLPFSDKTVLSLDDSTTISSLNISDKLFLFEQFMEKLSKQITYHEPYQKEWFSEGISCSALVPEQKWQTGKLRIRLEFIPDSVGEVEETEPEPTVTPEEPSPLDDIRQTLLQNDR